MRTIVLNVTQLNSEEEVALLRHVWKYINEEVREEATVTISFGYEEDDEEERV